MTPTYGDTATRVLLAVLTQPRPTVPAVALAAGCSRGHAHTLLVELRDAGLVTWERGRSGTLRPACRVVAGTTAVSFGATLGGNETAPSQTPLHADPGPRRPLGGRLR